MERRPSTYERSAIPPVQKPRECEESHSTHSIDSEEEVPKIDSDEDPEIANVKHLVGGDICGNGGDDLHESDSESEAIEDGTVEMPNIIEETRKRKREPDSNSRLTSLDDEEDMREMNKLRKVFSAKDTAHISTPKGSDVTGSDANEDTEELEKRKLVFINASSEEGEVVTPDSVVPMDICAEAPAADGGENIDGGEAPEWGEEAEELEPGSVVAAMSILPPEERKATLKIANQKPIHVRVLVPSTLGGGYLKCVHDDSNPTGEKPLVKALARAKCVLVRRCRISLSTKVSNAQRANAAAVLVITDDRPLDAYAGFVPSEDLTAPPFGAYMCSKEDGERLIASIKNGDTVIHGFSFDKDRPVVRRQPLAPYVPRLRCPFCVAAMHTLCGCPHRENYAIVDLPCTFNDGTGSLQTVTLGPVRVVDCHSAQRAKTVVTRLYPMAKHVPVVPWSSIDNLTSPPTTRKGKTREMRSPEISHIFEEVYVGGGRNAGDRDTLRKNNISAVFDCASQYNIRSNVQKVCKEMGVDYCGITALDEPNYPLLQHYDQFERFMCKHARVQSASSKERAGEEGKPSESMPPPRRADKNILVICAEGVNRSCTLTACYLMAKRGWELLSIVERLRERRRVALTNPHFRYLMWAFVIRRNLSFGKQCVSTLHTPLNVWEERDIVEVAKDLVRLGTRYAPRLLDELRKEETSADNGIEFRGNLLRATHRAVMLQFKCTPFREILVRNIISWKVDTKLLEPLVKIWTQKKVVSEKLLRKALCNESLERGDGVNESKEEEPGGDVRKSPSIILDSIPEDDLKNDDENAGGNIPEETESEMKPSCDVEKPNCDVEKPSCDVEMKPSCDVESASCDVEKSVPTVAVNPEEVQTQQPEATVEECVE